MFYYTNDFQNQADNVKSVIINHSIQENFSCHLTDAKKRAARWQPTYITTYLQLIINLKKILS